VFYTWPPWWKAISFPFTDLGPGAPIEYEREAYIWKMLLVEGKRQRLRKWRKQGGEGTPPWFKPGREEETGEMVSHEREDEIWHTMSQEAHQFMLWA
jgi:hypothetical protein